MAKLSTLIDNFDGPALNESLWIFSFYRSGQYSFHDGKIYLQTFGLSESFWMLSSSDEYSVLDDIAYFHVYQATHGPTFRLTTPVGSISFILSDYDGENYFRIGSYLNPTGTVATVYIDRLVDGSWVRVPGMSLEGSTNHANRVRVSFQGSRSGVGEPYLALESFGVLPNDPPTVDLNIPEGGAIIPNVYSDFSFTGTDPDDDNISYHIQIGEPDFSSFHTSAESDEDSGFIDFDDFFNTSPFTSGSTITYTTQTPLTRGKTYGWRVRAKDDFSGYWTDWVSRTFTVAATTPTTTTGTSSNPTTTQMQVSGSVTDNGGAEITERGFVYSTSNNPTTLDNKRQVSSGMGDYSVVLTGLTPNTTYYWRSYAINSAGTAYGEVKTFNTRARPPVVQTGLPSGNSTNSVTINGSTISSNPDNQEILERGVVYSTNSNPTVDDNWILGSGQPFDVTIDGLQEDTTYYFRAYVQWGEFDFAYGSQVVRKTQGKPTTTLILPENFGFTDHTRPQVEFRGDDPDNSTISYHIQINDTSDFSTPDIEAYSSTDPGFSSVTDQKTDPFNPGSTVRYTMQQTYDRGTSFFWRVRGRDTNGSNEWGDWSSTRSFSIAAIPPSVQLYSVDNVSFTSASIQGEVTDDGGASIAERGVVYSTQPEPSIADHKVDVSGGVGTFTVDIEELSDSSRYYVRTYAVNSAGTSYSQQVSFLTEQTPNPPLVATGFATSITESTVEIRNSEVLLDGTQPVIERGVVFGVTSEPTIDDGKVIASSVGVGQYSVGVTGLSAETEYHVRAYAINNLGVGYGEEITFTTSEPFVPDEGDGYWTWAPDESSVVIGRSQPTPSHSSVDLYLSDLNLIDGETYTFHYSGINSTQGSPYVVIQWLDSGVKNQEVIQPNTPFTFSYDESKTNWAIRLFVTGQDSETNAINASFNNLYLAHESEFSGYAPFVANGTTEIKLENNWILDKRREDTIQNIFNIIDGEGWYPFKAKTTGLGWYEIGDRVTLVDQDGSRDVVVWDTSLTIDGGIQEELSASVPAKTETDYKKAGSIANALKRTQISVDHNEQQILSLISDIHSDNGVVNEKFSAIEQAVDSIASTVQSSGGVNLIRNSVMYSHEDPSSVNRENIALNKEVTGSSGASLGTYSLLTDGNTSTHPYVQGAAGLQYLQVDLGDVYEINEVRVWHYYSDGRTYFSPKTEVSEGGTDWVVVAQPSEYSESSGGHARTFTPIKARYVRDYINGSSQNTGNHWVELQVFETPQYVSSWEIEGPGSLVIQASPESKSAGGISGNAFTLSDMKVSQQVTVRKDADFIPEEEKQRYAFSAKVKKNVVGSAYIRLTNRNETHEIELPDQTGYYWEDVSLEALLPEDDHYVVEIWSDGDADLQVTDVMLSPGDNTRQWTQANGETMNTSVIINDESVSVRSSVFRNDFTRITALGFEVHKHDVDGDRIFGFNGDETNVYKFKADQQISLGPIRTVPLEYGNYKGIALTRTEEN